MPVVPVLNFELTPGSLSTPLLLRSLARYNAFLPPVAKGDSIGAPVYVYVPPDASETLSLISATPTQYNYSISSGGGSGPARISALSSYGAMYAMETIAQIATAHGGLPALSIVDAPLLTWRGLMLDAGRRFFNVSLVMNVLDTMAASKLNVLHWHLADDCRFGVESQLYPAVTSNLTGLLGGFYTAADLASIQAYAADRGISIVPEFDVPGHSHGLVALGEAGAVKFCYPTDPTRSQLYGDPQNTTLNTITALYAEMAGLFPASEVLHIGADETSAEGPCTTDSTFALERAILRSVQSVSGGNKTPAGWEEVLFDAGAATPETIVYAWSRYSPADIIATGRRAVDSSDAHWYFTDAAAPFPQGWAGCWSNPTSGVPAAGLPLLLGAEASMWTDRYCYANQCGASGGAAPIGAPLFPPSQDDAFGRSVGGMIWPRGLVAAGAFWGFDSTQDPTSPAFVAQIDALTNTIAARGGLVCPAGCLCDELTACGKPYIPVLPPSAGSAADVATCTAPFPSAALWALQGDGSLTLAANTSLCLVEPSGGGYPAALASCTTPPATSWRHDAVTAELVSAASGLCLDTRASDGVVGTYTCGSGEGFHQANQQWALDSTTGAIISLAGGCLQVK